MRETVIVGMTGASGQVYGVRALELLDDGEFEVHLIVSDSAKININQESDYTVSEVESLADEVYNNAHIGAPMSSGSFRTNWMIIAPCSMKTLSNIAHGNSKNLIARAADVILKERRPVVVLPREKPFNRIHLKNMLAIDEAGALVFPPFPSFYVETRSLDEMITRTMARALSHIGVEIEFEEWGGIG